MSGQQKWTRREFGRIAGAGMMGAALSCAHSGAPEQGDLMAKKPNVVLVFADQWRGQALGYAGDPCAPTPCIDALAAESVRFTNALSGCPVCTPYRGSLLTGQYWLTHGLFMNDVCLNPEANSMGKIFGAAGYDTAYIGKWHIDGHGRSSYIPKERRQGFEYWKVLECTHDYNNSMYYDDDPEPKHWEGYDAIAQTRDAQQYIRDHADGDNPFLLVMSWGPPHDPYFTAPEEFQQRVDKDCITLRPNVTEDWLERARDIHAGYYAHCAALDQCIGDMLGTLDDCGIADDTLFVFTSDHGDLLGSHGANNKQQPYAESLMVPLLLRWPGRMGREGRDWPTLFNAPDILPTLLGLADIPVPASVEGADYGAALLAGTVPEVDSALIMCVQPFGQWSFDRGGREYRGVFTGRHTYVRSLDGPWLLFDNEADPYQLDNLCNRPEHAALQGRLEEMLAGWLERTNDPFKPGKEHLDDWGYVTDKTGTVPYGA
jgi:arylsulfatase A-like enzyme